MLRGGCVPPHGVHLAPSPPFRTSSQAVHLFDTLKVAKRVASFALRLTIKSDNNTHINEFKHLIHSQKLFFENINKHHKCQQC